jgi:ceramide glucosyltransferase
MVILTGLGWLCLVLATVGILYTAATAAFVQSFFRQARPPASSFAGRISLLKPLHGAEPALREDLATVFAQAANHRVEIVFGLQNPRDPARPIVEALMAQHRRVPARLRIGEAQAANRKIGNLIQMSQVRLGEVLVLTDSDIGLPPGHLGQVLAALTQPGVGVVTCPYYGVGRTGFWSRVAAMGLSYQFTPNLITGVSLGMAKPCMGSTVALRQDTLRRIGGFEAFRDTLADDYAIGEAVRGLGLASVVAPILVSHSCVERTLGALFSHELRWAKTVKSVDPGGYAGSIVTHPLALALLAFLLLADRPVAAAVVAGAVIARLALMVAIDQAVGRPLKDWPLLVLRDIISFAVFIGSFFGRTVTWRGEKLRVTPSGRLTRV